MKRVILQIFLVLACTGAVLSPKDAANRSGKPMAKARMVKPAAELLTLPPMWDTNLLPLMPAIAIVPRPAKPYHITLAWDSASGIRSNQIYVATNAPLPQPLRTIVVTNNFGTVSNLWANTVYWFSCTALSNGAESDLATPPVIWPRPRTNYMNVGVSSSTNGGWVISETITNPAGYYRLQRLTNAFSFQNAPSLRGPWGVVSNWPASSPPNIFWLRYSTYDNVSGLAKPD